MARFRVFVSLLFIAASVFSLPPPQTLPDSASWGWGAQRFMKKLAAGDSAKLVFVGQSITTPNNNPWTSTVANNIKAIYPSLTYDYGAEGGCTANCLVGEVAGGIDPTVYNRIASYATLKTAGCVLVYVYGDESGFELLVKNLKEVIPADCDIVFMGNHVSGDGGGFDNAYMPYYFLPDMCNRHNLGWIDIATPWVQYLVDNNLQGQALRIDDVHLNPDGETLMGQLVTPYFIVRNVTTPPRIDAVWAVAGEKVFVRFSCKIDSTSAQRPANYAITSATVTGAQLDGDLKTVVLSTSGIKAGSYTLTVNGVKDREPASNTVTGATKTFTVAAAPVDWSEVDIGASDGVKGSMTHTAGSTDFVVNSNGGDNIFFHKNELHYVYQQAFGDCEIVAKVTAITKTATDCRALVLIRDDTTCYARFASTSVCLRQTNPTAVWQNAGAEFLYRPMWYNYITDTRQMNNPIPRWIRISRVGNVFTGYESADGNTWSQIGTAVMPMSHEVTIGLGAASQGTYGMNGTATFSNVKVTSSPASAVSRSATLTCPAIVPGFSVKGDAIRLNGLSDIAKSITVSTLDGPCVLPLQNIVRSCLYYSEYARCVRSEGDGGWGEPYGVHRKGIGEIIRIWL